MQIAVDLVSWLFLSMGMFLGLTGAYGILKFPDFYTRVHAASISDTLCTACFVIGLALQSGFNLVTAKLFMILILLWLTGPAASHALVRAANTAGLKPVTEKKD
ncbi:MAG: monovalent cation/H(+) antiporter subunit G [Acidiferrobacterales bacterium]|nr:monovalent cation/H(+) antiporter subunit G [Acidiferrobacterales bacterium]